MKKILLILALFFASSLQVLAANQYSSQAQYKAIEDEIFTMQRGWITEMAKSLQIDTKTGLRQSGNMNLTMKIGTTFGSGSMNLSFTKLEATVDAKNANMEASYAGKLTFEMKMPDEKYDEKSDTYISTVNVVKGEIRFGMTLIQADGSSYMRLDEIDIKASGDTITQEDVSNMLKEARKYVGKNYKLPDTENIQNIDLETLQKKILEGVRILESRSLFSVLSKQKDGSYRLKINTETYKALGGQIKKSSGTEIYTYSNKNGTKELRLSPRRNSKNNYITLRDVGGVYSLAMKIYEKSRFNTRDINLLISKDMWYLSSKDKDLTLSMSWKNADLNIDIKTPKTIGEDKGHHVSIDGTLSRDMKTSDLTIKYNDKRLGNLNSSVNPSGETSFRGNFDFSNEFINFFIEMSGFYKEIKGDYTVLPPSIFELLE